MFVPTAGQCSAAGKQKNDMIQQTAIRRLRTRDYVDRLHDEAMAREARPFPWLMMGLPALLILFLYLGSPHGPLSGIDVLTDAGPLGHLALAAIATKTFVAAGRWLLRLLWPTISDYARNSFDNHFGSLQPWQQLTFFLVIFFGLLYAFIACLAVFFP